MLLILMEKSLIKHAFGLRVKIVYSGTQLTLVSSTFGRKKSNRLGLFSHWHFAEADQEHRFFTNVESCITSTEEAVVYFE